ncbi:MAG: hypothetical protein V4727_13670 [Verrucomicrobiota bacterium]
MKAIFAALFVGWLVNLSAFGQEKVAEATDPFVANPEASTPKIISVQLEYIEMSHKDLTRLLMEHKLKSSDATALRMKVQEMVEKDGAKVMETQLITARSNQKATAESLSEYIYPTEYDPPGEIMMKYLAESGRLPFNSATASSFETRNLGSSFEVEPSLDESGLLSVRFFSKYTWHSGDVIWHESKDPAGNIYKTSMPNFYSISVDASVDVVSGQYFLAGVVSPKDASGQVDTERKVMAFLKCDALSVVP